MALLGRIGRIPQCCNSRLLFRNICLTPCYEKNRKAGKPKQPDIAGTLPLTYEEATPPENIGVTKAWNSWNCSEYSNYAKSNISFANKVSFLVLTESNDCC